MNKVIAVAALYFLTACATLGGKEESTEPPEIYGNMQLDQAVNAAIDFGDPTLKAVKKLIKRRNVWPETSKVVFNRISKDTDSLKPNQMINAMHLYMSWPQYGQIELFEKMVRDDRPLVRQLGWQLASIVRNKNMAKSIQNLLERAVVNNNFERILVPEMATTLARHKMVESYTLVRTGLFKTNEEEFATAMIALNPERASEDFMDYLAQPDAEELRQMTMSTINVYAALIALKHMRVMPPSVSHQNLGHLFLYAISRNPALVELATDVIQDYIPASTDQMAFQLSQFEGWIQMAFVEGARRRMTPQLGLILSELKFVTSQRDVIDEIAMMRR